MFAHAMETETLDGYRRAGRAYSTYVTSPLPTSDDKLLFILTYMKQNPTQAVQGQLFGMTQSNVSKWYHIINPILQRAMDAQGFLPARTYEELTQMLMESDDMDDMAASSDNRPQPAGDPADSAAPDNQPQPVDDSADSDEPVLLFYHDGTERRICRPKDHHDQRLCYSGKSHDHVIKNIVMADGMATICFLSETMEGHMHDKRLADESGYLLPPGSILYQDTGFQGFSLPDVTIVQPKKKPRGGALTDAEKAENRRISSIRVRIEHIIGSVKRYRMIAERIRIHCADMRDMIMEICCGLHNFRQMFRLDEIVAHKP
jgi:hypothetical protein